MPVYQLLCPDCGHRFSGMVFAGTREPEKWVCAECGGDRAQRLADSAPVRIRLKCNMGRVAPVAAGEVRGPTNPGARSSTAFCVDGGITAI
ncbi:MAG: FmdB family zinc ribbon protein [Burkholderiales bacterium]